VRGPCHTSSVSRGRIFVVEDDTSLQAVLIRGLNEEGFRTEAARTGAEMLGRAADDSGRRPDAFVVDISLPDADGRDLCRAMRARGIDAPVLFLTASDALVDRLSGFSAGGDDYLTKPFAFAELVARLDALLRRAGSDSAAEAFGLRLDPITHAASVGRASVVLTPTEFRLLGRLLARPGEAVRRRDLIEAAWPSGSFVRDNTLDSYMARLRRKLQALPGAPTIETRRGLGYSLR